MQFAGSLRAESMFFTIILHTAGRKKGKGGIFMHSNLK